MNVLIACESSGTVREAFRAKGHDAWSCDLIPSDDNSPYHYQDDIFNVIKHNYHWDLMIAHPPCTYLCSSGLHWNNRVAGRAQKTEEAIEFVKKLLNLPIDKIALENPVGRIGTAIRKADQIIHPYMFGDDASKQTALWLKNLPLLKPTHMIEGRRVINPRTGKIAYRWANQCDNYGHDKTSPSPDRWKTRSKTFQGIAQAFANQWG